MRKLSLILMLAIAIWSSAIIVSAQPEPVVKVIKVNDIINPSIAEYIQRSIEESEKEGAHCLIIQLDTPGGLDLAMRQIVKTIMNARIPIVVYVYPSGARAASAGVMITMSADIAAMAPGTNIGAAHPVTLGGGKASKEMMEKIENDAVAYIKSIASKKGRNEKWAEEAVRKSVSITAEEALEKNVIDLLASNMDELAQKLDGWEVMKNGTTIKLRTKDARIVYVKMGLRQKILTALSNPNIAYILMMVGLAGLYFELSNPGSILPGVIGAISLILAFYALQTLPVNYAGVLFIILAIILFIAELKIVSHGILSIGGVISLTLGSLMLFRSPEPYLRVSLSVLLPTILLTSAFFITVVGLAIKAHRAKPHSGEKGMVGEIGTAETEIGPKGGKVFVHGEYWNATSDTIIEKGSTIEVMEVRNLRMKVKKVEE